MVGKDFKLPIDLITETAESFSPQLIQGFRQKLKKNNPKIVVMSPTFETKDFKKEEVVWQQYHLCTDVAGHQFLGGKHILILGPESGKISWLKKLQYLQKKYHCQWTLLRGEKPKWIFHNLCNLLRPLELVPASRERVVPAEWQARTVLGDCMSRAKVIPAQAPEYRQYALVRTFWTLQI